MVGSRWSERRRSFEREGDPERAVQLEELDGRELANEVREVAFRDELQRIAQDGGVLLQALAQPDIDLRAMLCRRVCTGAQIT